MADSPFSFIFGGNSGLTYEQLKQRQAIATALASKSRGFPKTLGEGLTYFGESIGEAAQAAQLRRAEAEYEAKRRAEVSQLYGGGATATPPSTPPATPTANTAQQQQIEPGVTQVATQQDANPPAVSGQGQIAGEDQMTTAAAQPSSMLSPKLPVPNLVPPARPATAQAAPAGFRPAPAYLRGALERLEPDPTMRAYFGQLASGEAQSPNAVSKTGAAGPFQFTRGTGAQYGLLDAQGDRRTDIDASITGAQQLTRDNIREFQQVHGRLPNMGELALMHQQGGRTGANMIAGTGNAPAGNLQVNNVDPSLGPQEAAQRVMSYYGMPSATVPEGWLSGPAGPSGGDPRAAVASALVGQGGGAQGGTQVASLTPPGGTATDASNPATPTSIQPAPRPVQTVQMGPPTDRFQGAPVAAPTDRLPEFVMAKPVPPDPPRQVPVEPAETAARRSAALTSDPQLKAAYETRAAELADKRKFQQDRENTLFNAAVQHYQQRDTAYQSWLQNRQKLRDEEAQRAYGLNEAAQKRSTAETFGTMPQWMVEDLTKRRDTANASVLGLEGVQNARKAIEAGALFGPGSFAKLAWYQAKAELGDKNAQRIVAATQTFQSNMGGQIAQMIKQYAGKDVSKQELDYVQSIAGGKASQDKKAVERTLEIAERSATQHINDHRAHIDRVLANQPDAVRRSFEANKPGAPVDVPGGEPPVVNVPSEAEALKLGKGTRFKLPDGRTGTVQ